MKSDKSRRKNLLEVITLVPRVQIVVQIFIFLLISISYLSQVSLERQHIHDLARESARSRFFKDLEFRSWAAMHGGVYVPITDTTQPNPYLTADEKNISTPKGKKLTLMNPAYMTRQMYDLIDLDQNVVNRITSLNPIRPQNMADDWEKEALKSFEKGNLESFEQLPYLGEDYYRYMRPLITTQDCLKCHARHGYQLGQIRGGISISLKAEPYQQVIEANTSRLFLLHLISLLVVNAAIILMNRGIKRALIVQKKAVSELAKKENELKLALEYAENSEKVKTSFLANMSHEIRTPLNSIMGFSELLEDENTDKTDQKKFLQLIQKNGDSLLNIINDILDLSLIESKQFKIETSTVDLNQLIQDLFIEYQTRIELKELDDIVITKEIPNSNTRIQSDPKRIHQILVNFLDNAIKYTEEGVITIGYRITDEEEVELYVRDTGTGIEAGKIDEIFGMFNRLEKSLSKPAKGAGLGLHLSQQLSKQLGGRIKVYSIPDEGSTFSLMLPANS